MEKKVYTVAESLEEMKSIALENLKNPVHREFVNDTLIEARKHEAVEANLARQLSALEEAYEEEMQASLIEETVQRLTEEVYALSDERSRAQTALKSGLRAVMGMTDAQKVAAATVLFELMHKYDLHTGMNVDEQTAVIDSFLLDVDENHAAQMTATGMAELYSLLKDWNTRVCDKVIERDEARVGLGTGRMAAARQASDRAWRDLRTATNAFAYVQGDEGYAAFIGYMNVLIIRYKRTHLNEKVESPEDVEDAEGGNGEPATPSEPSNPGNGTGTGGNGTGGENGGNGTGTGGTGSGTDDRQKYTVAWYYPNGNPIVWYELYPGETIPPAPECPEGYFWHPYPTVMPAFDLDIIPEKIKG